MRPATLRRIIIPRCHTPAEVQAFDGWPYFTQIDRIMQP